MTEPPPPRDITPLRQPMVTSLGIIMGFLLNFLATWATEDDGGETVSTVADYAVAIALLTAIALMCVVLFRLLDVRPPDAVREARYHVTFRLYVLAIVTAFSGLALALFV